MKIAILILAAGTSSRMGQPKQLLQYNGKTIIETVINNAINSDSANCYVVLGKDAELIKQQVDFSSTSVIVNNEFEKGLSSSIAKGISKLLNYDAILITLGDYPKVGDIYYNEMITEFKTNPNYIIASKHATTKGVPALFPKKYYSELLKLKGDKGAKELLNSKILPIKTIDYLVDLIDIDTPEDYQNLLKTTNPIY